MRLELGELGRRFGILGPTWVFSALCQAENTHAEPQILNH